MLLARSVFVQLGLFPVNIQTGDGTVYEKGRLQSTDDVSEFYVLGPNRVPQLVATGPGLVKQGRAMGDLFADGTRAKYALQMADGSTWLAQIAAGCGSCGNPLGRWVKS